ncbi:hypothetical protein RHMOL_Rhmol05G0141100 [Rhododendron molle]|uniref:Uncharacterized protein n=1 Tax=Rhododendron molle TaxID=49168 RepID=A0ACC0NR28_RHOML|nr:hypothetical protein RHMOL_Rhmol05G0141100 [Rhododendron molle]
MVTLAESWRDTTNTFHLPPGEVTVTPKDFAVITGLRVGEEPIPFDTGIHGDVAALEWFLREVPLLDDDMVKYEQFKAYLKKDVATVQEAEQMLWAYEVLRMYPLQTKCLDLRILPCALFWSKENMGVKEGRGDLNAFKLYLDELRALQI